MEERSYHFSQEKKQALRELLFTEKELPVFPEEIDHISYLDGVKVYFKNGGWVIARFSGTEPLLRIFSEMPTADEAAAVCRLFETFLGIIQDPQ
jgi:phosphomannomutase